MLKIKVGQPGRGKGVIRIKKRKKLQGRAELKGRCRTGGYLEAGWVGGPLNASPKNRA